MEDPGPKLYGELAEWWPLLSAPEDYADEAERYRRVLVEAVEGPLDEVLELGSGGGNNASHLKRWFRLTLVDRSPDMLAVSRRLNPECDHVAGDMRTVRLGRTFDAVFVHDAIAYITTREDLLDLFVTAAEHCRPGGGALFVPDWIRETFRPGTDHGGRDGPDRAMRYLDWTWDPDPEDETHLMDLTYVLHEPDGSVRVEHDRHVCGLFPRAVWLELLDRAGFEAGSIPLPADWWPVGSEGFLGIRRG
jgi:SAM-dependent methyltransferase